MPRIPSTALRDAARLFTRRATGARFEGNFPASTLLPDPPPDLLSPSPEKNHTNEGKIKARIAWWLSARREREKTYTLASSAYMTAHIVAGTLGFCLYVAQEQLAFSTEKRRTIRRRWSRRSTNAENNPHSESNEPQCRRSKPEARTHGFAAISALKRRFEERSVDRPRAFRHRLSPSSVRPNRSRPLCDNAPDVKSSIRERRIYTEDGIVFRGCPPLALLERLRAE
jgi:hypothetical protein